MLASMRQRWWGPHCDVSNTAGQIGDGEPAGHCGGGQREQEDYDGNDNKSNMRKKELEQ